MLKSICEIHIPEIYGNETSKFFYTTMLLRRTRQRKLNYVAEVKSKYGITIIANPQIPLTSPDTSPMSFFGFGYLKQKLERRRPMAIAGLWKVLNAI